MLANRGPGIGAFGGADGALAGPQAEEWFRYWVSAHT